MIFPSQTRKNTYIIAQRTQAAGLKGGRLIVGVLQFFFQLPSDFYPFGNQ
jgi:hypothetical protein